MTGYNEVPPSVHTAREVGLDAFLRKPVGARDITRMLAAVARSDEAALQRYRAEAQAEGDVADAAQGST
jgi:hypothetical protein